MLNTMSQKKPTKMTMVWIVMMKNQIHKRIVHKERIPVIQVPMNRPFSRWCHLTISTRSNISFPSNFKFCNNGSNWHKKTRIKMRDSGNCSQLTP